MKTERRITMEVYENEIKDAIEIAKLLSKINNSKNKAIAKAQIKSFIDGFVSREEFCNTENKTA